MSSTETMAPAMKAKKEVKRKANRPPAEIVVESIIRLPLGEMSRAAELLCQKDRDTAEFFFGKVHAILSKNSA